VPVITKLLATKDNNIKVYVDKKFAFTLSPNEVVEHRLNKGTNLSIKKLSSLQERGNYEKYYLKSLNLISYRPRSKHEIMNYLSRQSVASENISKIIETLTGQGYLNDFDFALVFTNSKVNQKQRGPQRIRQELLSKGISTEIINQVFTQVFPDQESLLDLAQRALSKKSKAFSRLSPEQLRHKTYQYLNRQGFDYTTINTLLADFID